MRRLAMMLFGVFFPFNFQPDLDSPVSAGDQDRCSLAANPLVPCSGIEVALLDPCARDELYGDGRCHIFCPERDPDCSAGDQAADDDRDGLADSWEEQIVRDYLPFMSMHPQERCARSALVYRLRPHPQDRKLLHLTAVVLFEEDCGAKSHLGDNEAFGMTIDPSRPAPEGIVALRAIAHQNTICESVTDCGSCPELPSCQLASDGKSRRPVVYYSRDKHGSYLDLESCNGACFWTNWCELHPQPARLPLINVGEPGSPLSRDLTAAGLITRANGWSRQALFHFDPWGGSKFGAASRVTENLTDSALLTPVCSR